MLLKKIQAFYKFFSFSKRYTFLIFVVYSALETCLDEDYRLPVTCIKMESAACGAV